MIVGLLLSIPTFVLPSVLPTQALADTCKPCYVGRASSVIVMGWSDVGWNWGSANGDAHDVAMRVRSDLATPEARVKFLQDTSAGASSFDDAKMALALGCQRARNLGYDTADGVRDGGKWPTGGKWESLMEEMAACNFEGEGNSGNETLAEAIRKRLKASAYDGETQTRAAPSLLWIASLRNTLCTTVLSSTLFPAVHSNHGF